MTAEAALQTTHACPVCGDGGHMRLLCRVDGKDIFTCATCSADHVFPMPSESALKAYYDRREWFEGGEKGGYENYDAQTGTAPDMMATLLAPYAGRGEFSILDLGCGYGTHLAAAAKAGWKCFGVEPSAHARKVAQERLGGAAYVVESIGDLIPHEFDIVLMLDVIEHLPSPYPPFYQLFSIGAITAKTLVVITTPNADAKEAKRDPGAWPYRHPASHLVHYTSDALDYLLRRIHFSTIETWGLVPEVAPGADLAASAGLLIKARGSDFTEFMRERYVPGTWSKLAEYEHLPRYALAKTLATDKAVLDFGCGTGYGAALMADAAAKVTGLDIDAAALSWARASHHNARLDFRRHDDLGASLSAASFDLVTCFEMIEHVDHATQKATVTGIARLLKDDGLLLISTPNPAVTALYGANPYHLREMNEAEFRDLLSPHFAHIHILRQCVRVGVAISSDGDDRLTPSTLGAENATEIPLAFIAICSRQALPAMQGRIYFDQDTDYIRQFTTQQQSLHNAHLDTYLQGQLAHSLQGQLDRAVSAHDATQATLLRERASAAVASQIKEAELGALKVAQSSPRYLARKLLSATLARVHTIFTRKPGG